MAATPTTKSQVQAYRFVQRRMESALVRRDAVMLHDPMRTHLRAGIVGLSLALVAVAGVFIFGFFKPREALGTTDGIVMGADSGAVFVYVNNPTSRLIPVTNLASARLILIKQSGTAGAGVAATATPRKIADDILKDVPRETLAGIPGAPNDIPRSDELVDPKWSLCDTTVVDRSLPPQVQLQRAQITSTATIGIGQLGRTLGGTEALLVRSAQNQKHYLVYNGKRAEVDLNDPAVTLALNLAADQAERRPVSNGLLNAIPEDPPLRVPQIKNAKQPLTAYHVQDGLVVGSVVRTERAEGSKFYVLLSSGRQEIPRSVANLIRASNNNDVAIPAVAPGLITTAPEAAEADRIKVDNYPQDVPVVVPVDKSVVTCLYWSFQDGRQRTAITVADALTLPGGQRPVTLAQADGSGDYLDQVFLPPGKGAAVRGVVPDQPPNTGTIYLVTDLGTKFGIPSTAKASSIDLAAALGLGNFQPAPEAILRLLPKGAALDPAAVRRFDAMPVAAGGVALPEPGQLGAQPVTPPAPSDEGDDATGAGGG
jgi:type VII secretion protein EccB